MDGEEARRDEHAILPANAETSPQGGHQPEVHEPPLIDTPEPGVLGPFASTGSSPTATDTDASSVGYDSLTQHSYQCDSKEIQSPASRSNTGASLAEDYALEHASAVPAAQAAAGRHRNETANHRRLHATQPPTQPIFTSGSEDMEYPADDLLVRDA